MMFFNNYRQLRLGKSWVFPDGYSIRLYGGHLVLECIKVLGVGGVTSELFQLQMGFLFSFLRANDLRSSLLIIRARIFLLSCM